MVMKIKKKKLTQAVILGLLLAVPLGAQADDYTTRILYIDYFQAGDYTGKKNSKNENIKTDDGTTHTFKFDSDDRLIVNNEYGAVYISGTHANGIYDLESLNYIELIDVIDDKDNDGNFNTHNRIAVNVGWGSNTTLSEL